jgi:hypothetical protein
VFGHGVAALVVLDVVDEGFDRLAGEAAVLDALWQHARTFVAPAELQEETVPDVTFLVGARRAAGVDPSEDFLIAAALERADPEVVVADAEEPTAPAT